MATRYSVEFKIQLGGEYCKTKVVAKSSSEVDVKKLKESLRDMNLEDLRELFLYCLDDAQVEIVNVEYNGWCR